MPAKFDQRRTYDRAQQWQTVLGPELTELLIEQVHKMIDDWDFTARQFGYSNERDMLEKMYLDENRSIGEISNLLSCGSATVSRRMDVLQIPKRSRGGDNNPGQQTFKLTHLDQRVVLSLPLNDLPDLTKISRSMWYKYRRQRGILHNLTDSGVGALQPVVQPPSSFAANHQPEVRPVLPSEESGR